MVDTATVPLWGNRVRVLLLIETCKSNSQCLEVVGIMKLWIYIQAITLVSKTQLEDYVAVWLPYAAKIFFPLHAGRDFL